MPGWLNSDPIAVDDDLNTVAGGEIELFGGVAEQRGVTNSHLDLPGFC
jgi:hypothetical protein